jgi:hypothetical protein
VIGNSASYPKGTLETGMYDMSTLPSLSLLENSERLFFFYRCTVHSDIHTVNSPTDAHLLKL